jgi:hypothetical protein
MSMRKRASRDPQSCIVSPMHGVDRRMMPEGEGGMDRSSLNLRLLTPFEREVITLLREILAHVKSIAAERQD